MGTLYENESGVTAGGYSDLYNANSATYSSDGTLVVNEKNPIGYDASGNVNAIYGGIIVETVNKQFVNSTEKYYINRIIEYGMFKDTYDRDNDGIVDNAKDAVNAEYATRAASATDAEHALNADETNHALTADTANYALVAKQLENSSTSTTVTENQINLWNSKQDSLGYTPENSVNKGLPNGYVPLDSDGKVDERFLNNPRWETIENRPIATVDDIDDAVVKKHSHSNKSTLDRISENVNGLPVWNSQEWPYMGDMKKSVYDGDNDGIVDRSKSTDHVAWKNISSKPESDVTAIDDAVSKKHYHSNLDALAFIDKDGNDLPLWNGRTWPYDMSQAMYDQDRDGVIDEASRARSVDWSGVLNKPNSTIEEIDSAVADTHTHTNLNVLELVNTNLVEDRLTFKGKEIAFKEEINNTATTPSGDITTRFSVEIDSDSNAIQLVGDKSFPDANMYYGTDKNQNRGFHKLPTTQFTGVNSIKIDSLGRASLENDNPTPDANMYYGTNSQGVRGFYNLPEAQSSTSFPDEISATIITQDSDHRFVNDAQLENINKIDNIVEQLDEITNNSSSGEVVSGNVVGNGCRQCAISLPNNFFILDGSDLILRANKDNPALLSFSIGKNKEVIKELTNNITIPNVPSVLSNGTAYIYIFVEKDTNLIKANKTQYKPIYSASMPTEIESGRYWFNINNYTMYISNGNTYLPAEEHTLFVGEITAVGSKVSSIVYACNGLYDSGWFNVAYSTTYNKNHNLGTDLVTITAYRGLNGVNLGEFAFAIHGGANISDNTAMGDRVSKVTDTSIQTTRYNKMQYGDTIYASSNQHRVIVKRLW